MCGRFVGSFTMGDLLDEIGLATASVGLAIPQDGRETVLCDDFNVAPTRLVPVVRVDGDGIVVEAMRWGLVPAWAKEMPRGQALVNARSETVHEKPTFRNLVRGHRCLVPMNGFYEWDRSDARHKVPYFVPRLDGHLMLCLALWSRPSILEGLATCAVLTKESGSDLSHIHDRSPVQVDAAAAIGWLTGEEDVDTVIVKPAPVLGPRRVSDAVNSVRNNGAHLIEEATDGDKTDGSTFGPLFG